MSIMSLSLYDIQELAASYQELRYRGLLLQLMLLNRGYIAQKMMQSLRKLLRVTIMIWLVTWYEI